MIKLKPLEIIGWLGSMLFCFCALPQAIQIWLTHHTTDISATFLAMWFGGECLTFLYVLISNIEAKKYQWPLLANYVLNFLILCYICYAKLIYG